MISEELLTQNVFRAIYDVLVWGIPEIVVPHDVNWLCCLTSRPCKCKRLPRNRSWVRYPGGELENILSSHRAQQREVSHRCPEEHGERPEAKK